MVAALCFWLVWVVVCFLCVAASHKGSQPPTSFLILELWAKDCHNRHDERSIGGKKKGYSDAHCVGYISIGVSTSGIGSFSGCLQPFWSGTLIW